MNWFTYAWVVVKDTVLGVFTSNKDKAPFEDTECELDIEIYTANGGFLVHIRYEKVESNYVAASIDDVMSIIEKATRQIDPINN